MSVEDIRMRMIKYLAQLISWEVEKVESKTDKIYRINSQFATMRKLPRYVLDHVVRRKTREQVLDCHFKSKLKMDNVDIIVLKKIPVRILKKRKGCNVILFY